MIPSRSGCRRAPIERVCEHLGSSELQAEGEGFVAVKIVHTTRSQEVRFGDRATAEHYAAQYGGLEAWRVVPVPGGYLPDGCQAGSRESHHR